MLDLQNPRDVKEMFAHHPPKNELAKKRHEAVRDAAETFAKTIIAATPRCADQTTAIRHVRIAMMWANAAIALDGRV